MQVGDTITVSDAPAASFAETLRQTPGYAQQIVHVTEQPARPAQFAAPEQPLAASLQKRLDALGLTALYTHQAQSLNAAQRGDNVCVITATASGKSLCYVLPILDRLLNEPNGRALLLFPTKALLHDQKTALQELIGDLPITVGVYDGDTKGGDVSAARRCQIVLSNPDKMHMGMLPYAGSGQGWEPFVQNLRFVVIDEAHSYSGIFGGHVGLVLRRLFRACERVGNKPQVICASATIGNPQAHVENLTGVSDPVVIDQNGAPAGPREIVFWQARRTAEQESLALFIALLRQGKQTLLFTANRQSADKLARQAVEENPDLQQKIASYRAGYLPEERRRIETGMRSGDLRGLISTNANELGVNIGALDAVVMCGYPGTVASFWQQAGRAGRSKQAALAVLVGGNTPLEAYYFNNPPALLAAAVEPAHLPVENPNLLRDQLWCAARDGALKRSDSRWFGGEESMREAAARLVEDGRLVRTPAGKPGPDGQPRYFYALPNQETFPPQMVNLRSIGSVTFDLRDGRGQIIERGLTLMHVLHEAYPGAIYHSQFRLYKIEDVDYPNLTVNARELDSDPGYTTQANGLTLIEDKTEAHSQSCGAVSCAWGSVSVVERVSGYTEKPRGSGTAREVELSLLPRKLETQAVWWDIPPEVLEKLVEQGHNELASMQGLAKLLLALLPLFSQSDPRDTASAVFLTGDAPNTSGFIAVYDDVEGGCGLTRRGFDQAGDWLKKAEERLTTCRCVQGCPACIHAGPHNSRNGFLDKSGARLLARLMLGIAKAAPTPARPKGPPAPTVTITPVPKFQPTRPAPPVTRTERPLVSEYIEQPLYGVASAPVNPTAEPATTLAEVQARWHLVRGELRARSLSRLFEYVLAAEPVAVKGATLTLDFGSDAEMARLFSERENRKLMESIFHRVLGISYRMRCIAKGFDSKEK